MNKKICFSCIIGLAAVAIFLLYFLWPENLTKDKAPDFSKGELTIVSANGQTHNFAVEIAQTPEQHQYGLMFRKSLPKDAGMLFLFDKEEVASFWMKNTYIPLDMIFIKSDGTIAKIIPNTAPNDLRSQSSEVPVKSVLELNAGESDKRGIKTGDKVAIISASPAAETGKP